MCIIVTSGDSMKLTVKDVTFNEGLCKICVPLVGSTKEEIYEELQHLSWDTVDVVEWRMDMCNDLLDAVEIAKNISEDYPLLATFRTTFEGGKQVITNQEYVQLYKTLIDNKVVDMIDVEYQREEVVNELINYAHIHGVYVVLSYHNFNQTPLEKDFFMHLRTMQKLGGDICKIAVMPKSEEDVITVLQTSIHWKKQAIQPYIIVSMSPLGTITRLCAELMGCCMTFGKGVQESAPGQLSKEQLKEALLWLHHK